jgi:hypothetical protein
MRDGIFPDLIFSQARYNGMDSTPGRSLESLQSKTMKCFVIMPYGNREEDPRRKQELDGLYEHFIRPAVESVVIPGRNNEHVLCHRGDKEPGPGEIITHIIENSSCLSWRSPTLPVAIQTSSTNWVFVMP